MLRPILPVEPARMQASRILILVTLLILAVIQTACGPVTRSPIHTDAMAHLPSSGVAGYQSLFSRLQEAQTALRELRPQDTLRALNTVPPDDTPPNMMEAYHQLRAEAYTLTGNHLEAARERVWFDALLPDGSRRHDNQLRIWESLSHLSDATLSRMSRSGSMNALNGWMKLVLISRQNRKSQDAMNRAIQRWSQRYPDHPASAVLLKTLLAQVNETGERLNQVALLLPLSGPLANAGQAVRAGFVAARQAQKKRADRPTLKIYDVGEGPQAAVREYRRAVDEGAGMVVGPLSRPAVQALARSGGLRVPVLTLNYLDGNGGPRNTYQFGLSPEDEARQVAWQARLDNHERALILAPANDWGQRVKQAFEAQWRELGGQVVQAAGYNPQEVDFSPTIRTLLNIDLSTDRKKKLSKLLSRDLKFEPRRRKDADFIFLAALAKQARLLQPQLRFHHAADMPVYSTSDIYSGVPDLNKNRDLNGIRFVDMPWIISKNTPWAGLRSRLMKSSRAGRKHPRLLALGIDAYNILPYLTSRGEGALSRYNGATGNLFIDRNGRVHRELVWGRFSGGKLKPISNKVR